MSSKKKPFYESRIWLVNRITGQLWELNCFLRTHFYFQARVFKNVKIDDLKISKFTSFIKFKFNFEVHTHPRAGETNPFIVRALDTIQCLVTRRDHLPPPPPPSRKICISKRMNFWFTRQIFWPRHSPDWLNATSVNFVELILKIWILDLEFLN